MNRELIDSAARALTIEAVYLRDSRVRCRNGFLPQFIEEELSLVPQYKSGPTGTLIGVQANDASTDDAHRFILLAFSTAVRLVDGEALTAVQAGGDLVEEAQFLEIEADFCAQYRLKQSADVEELRPAIEEFGRYNLGYHVWPYWREFVQSTCARMGIPPIPVPTFRLPGNSAADAAE